MVNQPYAIGGSRRPASSLVDLALFDGVSARSRTRVLELAHLTHIRTGSFFFNEGGSAEHFFVLTAGRVKLTQLTPEGHQILLRLIGPGEAFGGAGAFGEPTYAVTGEAVEPSTALTWASAAMRSVLQAEPILAWNAVRIVTARLHDLQRRYHEVLTERVERRVARALLRLARHAGRRVDAGTEIDFAVTRHDIAEMTGTTLFTVSRLMSRWEARGFVSGGRQHIIVNDPHALANIAEESGSPTTQQAANTDDFVSGGNSHDIVDEASYDSFPASDSPPWTLGIESH